MKKEEQLAAIRQHHGLADTFEGNIAAVKKVLTYTGKRGVEACVKKIPSLVDAELLKTAYDKLPDIKF